MSKEELKSLIEKIEARRRERSLYQFGFFTFIALLVLFAGSVLAPYLPKSAPVAQTPKEEPRLTAYANIELSAKAAVVYDLVTGDVLYEKNAQSQLPLASLTKLLTLYAASQSLTPDAPVTMTQKALETEGDNGFLEGEVFTFEDAARMALVASSNDAAEAISEAATKVADAPNGTSLLKNAAAAVGLTQTYALNGTGLDENGEISGGYGSAHDIALLAGALLKRVPGIMRASIDPTITVRSLTGNSYTLKNTNPEVTHIPGLMLSKTGYTDLAGGNLAVVYDSGIGHPIAVVVLGSTKEERFTDVQKLVRATSAQFAGLSLPN